MSARASNATRPSWSGFAEISMLIPKPPSRRNGPPTWSRSISGNLGAARGGGASHTRRRRRNRPGAFGRDPPRRGERARIRRRASPLHAGTSRHLHVGLPGGVGNPRRLIPSGDEFDHRRSASATARPSLCEEKPEWRLNARQPAMSSPHCWLVLLGGNGMLLDKPLPAAAIGRGVAGRAAVRRGMSRIGARESEGAEALTLSKRATEMKPSTASNSARRLAAASR